MITDLYELAKKALDSNSLSDLMRLQSKITPHAIIELYERIDQLELEAERAGTPPWPDADRERQAVLDKLADEMGEEL